MSATEKKFVIKHVFTDILKMERGKSYNSPIEKHFGVQWHVMVFLDDDISLFLNCPYPHVNDDYCIETDIDLKLRQKTGRREMYSDSVKFSFEEGEYVCMKTISSSEIENYLEDGNLTVEFHVRILKMTGIKEVLRNFDESNKEFSDVVLIVDEQKFYVSKLSLAFHSTYFKSFFYGSFDESKQSEVELKDIDSGDFQNYLELIHAESLVDDDTVDGILKLADFFDSKTAIRRCEDFLLNSSQKTLKQKFELASQYKLESLMEQCISNLKTADDLRSIVPGDNVELDQKLANQLLRKSLSFGK